jgi:hypothetical protein
MIIKELQKSKTVTLFFCQNSARRWRKTGEKGWKFQVGRDTNLGSFLSFINRSVERKIGTTRDQSIYLIIRGSLVHPEASGQLSPPSDRKNFRELQLKSCDSFFVLQLCANK